MNTSEYIKRADYSDIKNIIEFIRKNIEENKFYFDFEDREKFEIDNNNKIMLYGINPSKITNAFEFYERKSLEEIGVAVY